MSEKPKTKPTDGRRSCLRMLLIAMFLSFLVVVVVPVALIMVEPTINSLDRGQCAAALPEISTLSVPSKTVNISTGMDAALIPINAGNAAKVQEIAHYGRGTIYDAFWNKAGDLLVLTSTGLWRHSKMHLFEASELLWTQPFVFYVPVISPDGSRIALTVSVPDKPIVVFDTDTGEYQRLNTDGDFVGGPEQMRFSPDGLYLAISDREQISIWDIASGRKVQSFPKVTDYIEDMVFSFDSALLAVAGRDIQPHGSEPDLIPTIRVWYWLTNEQRLEITPTEGVFGITFHPDGNRLVGMASTSVTASVNLRVRSWLLSSGELSQDTLPQTGNVPIVYSADGLYVAFGGNVYDVRTGDMIASHPPRGSFHVAFSPDTQWMAMVDYPGNNRLYISNLEHPGDYRQVTAYSEDYDFNRIEFRSDTEIAGYPKPDELMLHGLAPYPASSRITLSPDQTRFVLMERRFGYNDDMVVRLCDTASGSQLAFLRTKATPVFSHSGQYLLTAGECNLLEVRDGTSGEAIRTFGQCDKFGQIQSMAFEPGDTVLAITRLNRQPGLIDFVRFDTGQIIQTVQGRDWLMGGLAFNETGTLLASSSQDGTIRLWGVPSSE